jgi:hypothetical protein
MDSLEDLAKQLEREPKGVSFADLSNICKTYFGKPRTAGSHNIYKTPWQGDPRINIQNDKGKAKAYQVRQVVKALRRLEAEGGQ